jgi:hypothetical protein
VIFVFGSNESGRHGKGAALTAYQEHGAVYGEGEGFFGQSYAIPTKDRDLESLSLRRIKKNVERFIEFAKVNPEKSFKVTRIGCGLAGYRDEEIAPFFKGAPENCNLPEGWREL